MKILVINYEYPPVGGGGGVFCKDLCEEWAKRGHQVVVITSRVNGQKKTEEIKGVKIVRVYSGKRSDLAKASFLNLILFCPFGFFQGWKLLWKENYDFINTHFAIPSGLVGLLLGKIFRVKNILTLHGADIFDPSRKMSGDRWWLTRLAVALAINGSEETIASTNDIKSRATAKFRIKKEIRIIPLGFLPPKDKLLEKRNETIRKKNKIIFPLKLVTVGRLVKRKNLDFCLKIIAKYPNKLKLEVIGDGPEKNNLEKLASSLGTDNIRFSGRVSEEEKYEKLLNSDIFISTSLHEGFGVVFLEAMWCGLSIIASDVGGQVHFLKENENAKFFKNNDKKSLREALEFFIKNRQVSLEMGKRNSSFVNKFHISKISQQYLDLVK